MCLKERLQPALRPILITLVFLLAAAGFAIFNTGVSPPSSTHHHLTLAMNGSIKSAKSDTATFLQAARTVSDFNDMKRAAVLSTGILHLMSAYDGCRWAAFGTGLAALLVFPVVMIASAFASRIFIAARGKDCCCQPDSPCSGCPKRARDTLECQALYQIINWADQEPSLSADAVRA